MRYGEWFPMRTYASSTDSYVIDRFQVPAGKGYSSFWRKNTSPVEIRELAKLLSGLRKVASSIGPNVGTIVWSGMKHVHGIALDPRLVVGTYPVPSSKTDIMVGITVRKALEQVEWSDRLRKIVQSKIDLSPPYRYKFNLFFDTCEKVYLDCLSNRGVLGLYTKSSREWEISDKAESYLHPPTLAEFLHIWWELATEPKGKGLQEEYIDELLTKKSMISLGGKIDLAVYYKEPLTLLNSIVGPLSEECPRIPGVTERGNFRLRMYESIWDDFLEIMKFWPVDRSDPFLAPKDQKFEEEEEDEEEKDLKATCKNLVQQLEVSVEKEKPNYTSEVQNHVNDQDDVVEIVGNDIVMETRDMVDKSILSRLRQILKIAAQRRTICTRGLTSGKIDRRKLFRASTTGQAFLLKKNEFQLSSNMILVVDATGSMADPVKWDQTQAISQTLFTALKEYNNNARMFAYNEVKDKCRLTETYGSGKFYAVYPHGRTASGEAIIVTALKLKNSHKKACIIHVTDGASNWGCGVEDAIRYCKKKKINLLTLGIGCSPSARTSLTKEYGKLVQFIEHVNELPRLFGAQLRSSRW